MSAVVGRMAFSGEWERNTFSSKLQKKYEPPFYSLRSWQEAAFDKLRNKKYIILNAPTAAGKTLWIQAYVYDRLRNNSSMKAIIIVPQTIIADGFTDGHFVMPDGGRASFTIGTNEYSLCSGKSVTQQKTSKFKEFNKRNLTGADVTQRVLICTHSLFCKVFDKKDIKNTILVIDESHHVSSGKNNDEQNRLGKIVNACMKDPSIDILLSTATYMRGDAALILPEVAKSKFEIYKVTFDQYINDCAEDGLKGFDYKFYPDSGDMQETLNHLYSDAIGKDIVFIPSTRGSVEEKQKIKDLYKVLFAIAKVKPMKHSDFDKRYVKDKSEDIWKVKRGNEWVRVLNLVDDSVDRNGKKDVVHKSHRIETPKGKTYRDVDTLFDVVIALDMMKEGANWKWADRLIIMGDRGSFTELMQMLGRVLRDAPGKNFVHVHHLIKTNTKWEGKVRERNEEKLNNITKAVFYSLLIEDTLCFKGMREDGRSHSIRNVFFTHRGDVYNNAMIEIQQQCLKIEASQISKERKEELKQEVFIQAATKYSTSENTMDPVALRKCIEFRIKKMLKKCVSDLAKQTKLKLASRVDTKYLNSLDMSLIIDESPYLAMQYVYSTAEWSSVSFDAFRTVVRDKQFEDVEEQLALIKSIPVKSEEFRVTLYKANKVSA